jgi:2-hydroxymethylglutarate dehydrogenase
VVKINLTKHKEKIGFIGLGAMGSRMAKNLIDDGFEITVFDIKMEAIKPLLIEGAKTAKNPREVGSKSDIVILSLPSPSEVIDTVLGKNGVLEGLKKGGVIIDTSTIDPHSAKRVAKAAGEKGIEMIDAPVSGGTFGAEKGTLSIMIGGSEKTLNSCMHVLNVIGKNIYHVGEIGSGQVFKLINNMLVGINLIAVSEALVLASKAGANLETLYKVIKASSGNSWAFDIKAPSMVKKEFEPGFKIWLQHKDLGLAMDMASNYGVPTPLLAYSYEIFKSAKAIGLEDLDHSAIIKFAEKISETKI